MIGGALCILAAIGLLCSFSCGWGWLKGYQKGWSEGREEAADNCAKLEADNWWINAELQVDQERVKIWREER